MEIFSSFSGSDRTDVLAKRPRLETQMTAESNNRDENTDEVDISGKARVGGLPIKGYKRCLDTLIHMTFNRKHSFFEVTKRSKNHLAVMGVPLKNGGHILFPEEAVYLIEHCCAYATDGDRMLTLHGGYRILQECGIPMYKFLAYSLLRQSGFAALRPNRSYVHSLQLSVKSSVDSARPASEIVCRYPQDLLNLFPTRKRSHMFMPQLHRNERIVPIPNMSDFEPSTSGYKFSRKLRQQLRPNWWPCFEHIRQSASSWSQYACLRRMIADSRRTVAEQMHSSSNNTVYRYDFEVFLTDRYAHSLPLQPAFVVMCFESRDGAISCSYIHRFAGTIPLMLSIFDSGHVCFIEMSGKPIDLKQYLKDISARSVM